MRINAISNMPFKGTLTLENGQINTKDIVEMRPAGFGTTEIDVFDKKNNEINTYRSMCDYFKFLTAYTAASQNDDVNVFIV